MPGHIEKTVFISGGEQVLQANELKNKLLTVYTTKHEELTHEYKLE